ncbi:hypothetical protein NE857_26650 [Nocardiopsis exhalans]|uniref:Uncharacterized protein n=1 Tax=Nocardiopsis exhalans TaxID=163604 RepID=A0ABY5D4B8_9ACTN|nr:hypothetical protein [Nocardiopsis exhalans]USY18825.1 hypothetical protein NE857_26650 [Nocardiopsis exhalans]
MSTILQGGDRGAVGASEPRPRSHPVAVRQEAWKTLMLSDSFSGDGAPRFHRSTFVMWRTPDGHGT